LVEAAFKEFVEIMSRLRKECPWDREQTHESISGNTIEEAYEVVQAIDDKDPEELKKELGDLLLHVAFHSVIAEDSGNFNIEDVIHAITEKLIRRHPHIFADGTATNPEEIQQNWEAIKLSEGRKSVLEGIPQAMPALLRAHRIQEKAAKVGFDWEKKSDVWKKVEEEIQELSHEIKHDDAEKMEGEFGDVLFALINYARFIGVNPENALRKTTTKFEKRFAYIEEKLAEKNKKITESNLEEMDGYWNESKKFIQ
jgi:XTP/dITP diphosphohydrolase